MDNTMTINAMFEFGMKRYINDLIAPGPSKVNLGCGNTPIEGAYNLDLPDWDGSTDRIPMDDGSVDTVFAAHFLEHLTGAQAIVMLREVERVLAVGGTFNICVPHVLGTMAFHDLDHKSFWTVDTLRTLFSTPYYDKGREKPWLFEIRTNVIIGVVERNLCLLTQLVRREETFSEVFSG